MTTTTTAEKAARLIREKRVHYQFTTPDGGMVYWVDGDSGRTRTVTIDPEGLTTCDCPAMIADCAHSKAVLDLYQPPGARPALADPAPPLGSALSPEDPIETIPLPGSHPQGSPPKSPGPGDGSSDDDEDEVQVVGDAGPVPVLADPDRRDLIDLATAPVTWNTLREIARTEFVPASLRGKPTACLAAILTGRELGLGPMTSLRHIAVIDGSPTLSAELMLNLYRSAGHRLEVGQADDQVVTITGTRGDTGEVLTVTYGLRDAERAGLITITEDGEPKARSQNNRPLPWETYTPDLLWARAVTRLVRRLAPDLRGSEVVAP